LGAWQQASEVVGWVHFCEFRPSKTVGVQAIALNTEKPTQMAIPLQME
jgi:hypothetical protein